MATWYDHMPIMLDPNYEVHNMQESFPHFMIDIETLGTKPDAAVVQIGAVGFDFDTGEVSEPFRINCETHPKSSMDESTIRWWLSQTDEARKAVFNSEQWSPAYAVGKLAGFIAASSQEGYRVWSKPSSFDLVILESLYRNCGYEAPWKHWNTRCLRTLIELSGMERKDEVVPTIPHDAGEDALAQAKTALEAMSRIRKGMF